MFTVSNTQFLNNRQRFQRGLLFGSLTALVCAVLVSLLAFMMNRKFSILYIVIGIAVSNTVRHFGKGVTLKFSILGGVLTFLSIFLAEILTLYGFEIILRPELYLKAMTTVIGNSFDGASSIMFLIFQIIGIYIGFTNAKVS